MVYFVVKRVTKADWKPYSSVEPMLEGKTVFEAEAQYTGLLNEEGEPIMKRIGAIGFYPLAEKL